MTHPPPENGDVALAGAVSTLEEAVQVHQIRFILRWAMRVGSIAGREGPVPPLDAALPQVGASESWPPR